MAVAQPIRAYGLRGFFRISWFGIPAGAVEARPKSVVVPATEPPAAAPETITKP